MYSHTVLCESLVFDNEEKIGLIAQKDEFDEYPTQFKDCLKLHLSFLKTGFILRLPDEDETKKFLEPTLVATQLQLVKCIALG